MRANHGQREASSQPFACVAATITKIDVDPRPWKNKRQPVSSLVGHFAAEHVFAIGVTPKEVRIQMETFDVTGGVYFDPILTVRCLTYESS